MKKWTENILKLAFIRVTGKVTKRFANFSIRHNVLQKSQKIFILQTAKSHVLNIKNNQCLYPWVRFQEGNCFSRVWLMLLSRRGKTKVTFTSIKKEKVNKAALKHSERKSKRRWKPTTLFTTVRYFELSLFYLMLRGKI